MDVNTLKLILQYSEIVFAILISPFLWSLLCVSLVLYVIVLFLRWTLQNIGTTLNPDWADVLCDKDSVFGEDPAGGQQTNSTLFSYHVVEGDLSLEELQAKYYKNVVLSKNPKTGKLNFPKFQQYCIEWFGYKYWKWDKDFQIYNHIKLLEETADNLYTTEDQLLSILGKICNRPFPPERAYWEYLVVRNFKPRRGYSGTNNSKPFTLIIYRVHHVIGDGYSFLKQLVVQTCEDSLDKTIQYKPPSGSRKNPLLVISENAWKIFQVPYTYVKYLFTIDSNPWFLPKAQLDRKCVIGQTHQIPVDLVKNISKKYNVTFSAALLSAIGGGIYRFCKTKNVPPFEFTCMMPFPRPKHPNNTMINHWTAVRVKIFSNISNPIQRMELAEEDLTEIKNSTIPLGTHLGITFLSAWPIWFIKTIGANWFCTGVLTNFPGPRESLSYFKKYPIVDIPFWAPHLNGSAGIGISMITFIDTLRIGLNFDTAILKEQTDLDSLCHFIEEEIYELGASLEMDKKSLSFLSDENENNVPSNNKKFSEISTAPDLRLRSVS